ncbi:MAG: ribulose-phosphate 3-epimerase [Puniceicoccales bacterium]|jgi:ribulose-phosphate 3-epimerase|nr:ribulose-phosphate 3-epimerase [Puniceicoccales bacterium]
MVNLTVVPSLLACDRSGLLSVLRPLLSACRVPRLHFDGMDGYFVPNLGFCPQSLHDLKHALVREKLPVPLFEVHLMVRRPSRFWKNFADAGAQLISFHFECDDDIAHLAQELSRNGLASALYLNPETAFVSCIPLLEHFSLLTVMGVHPGFCGQRPISAIDEKIHAAANYRRRNGLSYDIAVDGGVSAENAPQLVAAGADFLIAGKAIFGAGNPQLAYDQLLLAARVRHGSCS